MDQPEAPDAKTPQKRTWWTRFRADQARKPAKSAPGGHVSGPSRRKTQAHPQKPPKTWMEARKTLQGQMA